MGKKLYGNHLKEDKESDSLFVKGMDKYGKKYVISNYLGTENLPLSKEYWTFLLGIWYRTDPESKGHEMKVIIALEAIIDIIQMLFHAVVLSWVTLSLKSIFFLAHDSWLYASITYQHSYKMCKFGRHLYYCSMTLQFQVHRGVTDIDIIPESSIISGDKRTDRTRIPQHDGRLKFSQIQFYKLTVELSQRLWYISINNSRISSGCHIATQVYSKTAHGLSKSKKTDSKLCTN